MSSRAACPRCGTPLRLQAGLPVQCGKCGTSITSLPQAAAIEARPREIPRQQGPVSAGNRKACAKCGADVTFAKRVRNDQGRLFCMACDPSEAPGEREFNSLLPPPPPVEQPVRPRPRALHETQKADSTQPNSGVPVKMIVSLLAGAIIAIGSSAYVLTRPSWEDLNRQKFAAIKRDADMLSTRGHPKEAYYKYKEAVDFIGNRKIKDLNFLSSVDEAKASLDTTYALAEPIIEREAAAERERQAAEKRRQAEEEKQRTVLGAREKEKQAEFERERQAQELARQEDARRQAAAAKAEAAQRGRRASFLSSPEFAAYKKTADDIVDSLGNTIITENSAYRSMSERSEAARDLLAVYIQIQGKLNDQDVTLDVLRLKNEAASRMIAENSAIRAIYKHDESFLELLGVWCQVLEKRDPRLHKAFLEESTAIQLQVFSDDSAVRAISGYCGAAMNVLVLIDSELGHGAEANSIVSSATLPNITEDSAWRVAMRNTEAEMNLILLMIPPNRKVEADRIRRSVELDNLGNDSALLHHSRCEQGIVDALHELISNP